MADVSALTNPLVSVIIPVYNVEKYLRDCVDSVLSQTYKNIEIILVDDGSPDNCPSICDEYATKDSRVRVIHKENGGLSDARNVGIDIANGEWLCFVDSDDVVNVEYVNVLLSAAIQNDCDIAICGYKRFSADEEINIKNSFSNTKTRIISPVEAFKNQYISDVTRYVVAWNKIYKKKLFSIDIRYPKGRLHEDDFTTYKLFFRANKIADLSAVLNFYRTRNESITAKYSTKRILDYITAHTESLVIIKGLNDKCFLAESLYVLFISYLKLYGNVDFDENKFKEIYHELVHVKNFLSLKRRVKFVYKKIQLAFIARKKNGYKCNNSNI